MKVAILGAGQVGLRLARRLVARGHVVTGSSRSEARFAEIAAAGARPIAADLLDEGSLAGLCEDQDAIAVLVAPGFGPQRERLYGEGIPKLLRAFLGSAAGRIIFVSSTAVYDGAEEGATITEQSPAQPGTPRSRPLFEAEEALRGELGRRAQVARLAGLYSRGRGPFSYVRRALEAGEPLSGPGGRLLNLIHDEDAARLLTALVEVPSLQLALGADGAPGTRAQLYGAYARAEGLPEPRFDEASHGVSGRRIVPRMSPIKPLFASFQAALASGDV